jgi:hypothetical protein
MTIVVAPAIHDEQFTIMIITYIILQIELYQISSCKHELDASKLRGFMASKQTVATYETMEYNYHVYCLIFGV